MCVCVCVCVCVGEIGGLGCTSRAIAAAPTNKSTVRLNNELTPWSLTSSSESNSHFCAKEIGPRFIESDKRRSG